ncbi:MAG: FHA domain-containing protein, partial [Gemmatimonadales bacterium]
MNDQALPSSTKTQVRLHLFQNGSWGANWCFAKDFRIGRDVACELFLNSDRVSRVHAEVICENGHWWVRDLGSRNGTFLNGGKIERARLGNPSTLQVAWGGPVLQITLERVKDEPDTFINDTHTPMSDGQPAGHLEDTFTRRKAFAPPRTPPEDS